MFWTDLYYLLFSAGPETNSRLDRPIVKVSRSHTHSQYDYSERVTSLSQRPLSTQHTTNKTNENICSLQDSKPRSQQLSNSKTYALDFTATRICSLLSHYRSLTTTTIIVIIIITIITPTIIYSIDIIRKNVHTNVVTKYDGIPCSNARISILILIVMNNNDNNSKSDGEKNLSFCIWNSKQTWKFISVFPPTFVKAKYEIFE